MLNSSDDGSSGARSCAPDEGDVEARPMNDRNRFVVEGFFFVVSVVVDRSSFASPEYVLTNTGCGMEVEDDWPPECSCCCC